GGPRVSSTLTLLDGEHMAASGSSGSFVDISLLPLSAVDHIDVLTDGASAIYGSDAVGGVVNVVTKKDYNGAESELRFVGTTDGGANELTASQLVGKAWDGGNILVDYEFDEQYGLDASQRKYIPDQGGSSSLVPKGTRNSLFLSGSQEIDSQTRISFQGIYSDRNSLSSTSDVNEIEDIFASVGGNTKAIGGSLNVQRSLVDDWMVTLSGNYSSVKQNSNTLETVVFD